MKQLSRRAACSFLYRKGLPYFGFGIASNTFLTVCTRRSSLNAAPRATQNTAKLLQESGDFLDEVVRLRQLAIPKKSNRYQTPNTNDIIRFESLVQALIEENIQETIKQASGLNYEVVKFKDIPSQLVFYGLRELQNHPVRGWGSYFINPAHQTDVLLEIPHIIFDRFTEKIGAEIFRRSAAHAFLIAGAHRHANGYNTADVCSSIPSIFQAVHKAWVSSKRKTWQVHSFEISTKSSFPRKTEAVLSDGLGDISPEVLDLSQRMRANGIHAYVYNQLSANAFLNKEVNQGISGKVFHSLGATHNIQGIYCHQVGAAFTHVELDAAIRRNFHHRDLAAQIIAESIQASS